MNYFKFQFTANKNNYFKLQFKCEKYELSLCQKIELDQFFFATWSEILFVFRTLELWRGLNVLAFSMDLGEIDSHHLCDKMSLWKWVQVDSWPRNGKKFSVLFVCHIYMFTQSQQRI